LRHCAEKRQEAAASLLSIFYPRIKIESFINNGVNYDAKGCIKTDISDIAEFKDEAKL
jgi:hypothetical protein